MRDYTALERRGFNVCGIVIDTCGGIADKTVEFLRHVLNETAPLQERAPLLEAAITRLQFATIRGLSETFERSRQEVMMRCAPPTSAPRVTPGLVDAAVRRYAAQQHTFF